ncbi:MAG: BrnT family toxin [Rhodospirillaceae bacterium]|nr:BrnT family toxin [Rhodospirillaceae bacterium]
MTHWTWDPAKNRANRRKHRLSFENAKRVFDDPLALSRLDTGSREERWLTLGLIEGVAVIVIHTWNETADNAATGRIISARKATKSEIKAYQDGAF